MNKFNHTAAILNRNMCLKQTGGSQEEEGVTCGFPGIDGIDRNDLLDLKTVDVAKKW